MAETELTLKAAGEIPTHVLVVDRDGRERRRITARLQSAGLEVRQEADWESGIEWIEAHGVDALVAELHSPRMDGIRLLHVARLRNPHVCVTLIVGPQEIEMATRAMDDGVHDFQTRPINVEKALAVIRRAAIVRDMAEKMSALEQRLDRKFGLESVIGNSAAITATLRRVRHAAASDATLWIWGESGTGKGRLARAVHQNSSRRDEALITLDCGGLPDDVLEREFCGTRGTGAGDEGHRSGRFVLADKGTLLLESVESLSPKGQALLLRILQEGRVRPMESESTIAVDVRLVVSSNLDLRLEVEERRFREDLFYRLNVVSVEVPALRHRRADIPLLLEHFLREESVASPIDVPILTSRAMQRINRYRWPGNIRELKNAAAAMILNWNGESLLDVDDLPPALQDLPDEERGYWIPLGMPLEEIERRAIEVALLSSNYDRRHAANSLGMSLRTFYRRLRGYGVDLPRSSGNQAMDSRSESS